MIPGMSPSDSVHCHLLSLRFLPIPSRGFDHSNSTSNWFTFTDDPGVTRTFLTTAACSAVICISIFMDSSTTTIRSAPRLPRLNLNLDHHTCDGLRHSFSLLRVSAVCGAIGTGIQLGHTRGSRRIWRILRCAFRGLQNLDFGLICFAVNCDSKLQCPLQYFRTCESPSSASIMRPLHKYATLLRPRARDWLDRSNLRVLVQVLQPLPPQSPLEFRAQLIRILLRLVYLQTRQSGLLSLARPWCR